MPSRDRNEIGSENRTFAGISRRRWLSMLGVGAAAGLAGCGSSDDGTATGDGQADTPMDESTPTETPENTQDFGETATDTTPVDQLPDPSGTYNAVTSASFSTLNPLYNTEDGAGDAIGYALDLGYTFDDNQEYFPLLYDMSTENGEVWVFDIREGLEFSDPYGEVTAESFVYQIQELHQSDWANTADTTSWSGVTVEQTGEYQFQAELENSQLLWPETFDPLLYPIPKDLVEPYVQEEDVEGLKEDEELLELQFTGNLGAFTLEEWERSAGTTYTRNDDYYLQDIEEGPELFGAAPYFEGVSVDVVEEQSSRLGALETGEADAAAIPPSRFEEFQEKDSVDVYQIPQPYNEKISVNMRDNGWNAGPGNLFRYKEFRQAMAMAISKQDLIDGVFRGLAAPHFTWQPRFSQFYPGDDNVPQFGVGDMYGADVAQERAQQAFEQSEYDYAFDGDTMVNPDGDQVELGILHSSGQETEQLMGEFVAQELGNNLGIQVTVEAIDGTRFNNEYWTAEPQGGTATIDGEEVTWENPTSTNPGPRSATSNQAWDMEIVFGLNTFPRNPLTNTAFFDGPTAYYNPVGYYPGFDAEGLFDQAEQATSPEEIQSALVELFANLAEEQPYIMLAFPDSLTGYNPSLVGPIENFSNGWNFPAWRFEE
ncbi:ABC transporter substrate-binding protein [Halobacteriales archaeon QH_8_67_27]|nr:MAG: ABC transporter substrate-binding protein [Halobacteriales archaeon QH_8_67_27]